MFEEIKRKIIEDELTKSWFKPEIIGMLENVVLQPIDKGKLSEDTGEPYILGKCASDGKVITYVENFHEHVPIEVKEYAPCTLMIHELLGHSYFNIQRKGALKVLPDKFGNILEKLIPEIKRVSESGREERLMKIFNEELGEGNLLLNDVFAILLMALDAYKSAPVTERNLEDIFNRYVKEDYLSFIDECDESRASAVTYMFANYKDGYFWSKVREVELDTVFKRGIDLSPYIRIWQKYEPKIVLEKFENFELY